MPSPGQVKGQALQQRAASAIIGSAKDSAAEAASIRQQGRLLGRNMGRPRSNGRTAPHLTHGCGVSMQEAQKTVHQKQPPGSRGECWVGT